MAKFNRTAPVAGTNLDQQDDERSVVSEVSVRGRCKFKLPKIEFKRFNGDIRDWLSFWAQFKKIHEDVEIDDHDKIEYLIQATSGDNYAKIVDSMQSRFGSEDLQIKVYVRELLKLIINNAIAPKRMQLFALYDQIETQLRALETLRITSDKCSAMLFPLIESCLTDDLLRAWHRSHLSSLQQFTSSNVSVTAEAAGDSSLQSRLQSLMIFLKNEVENEQRISLAAEGFGLSSVTVNGNDYINKKKKPTKITSTPTAMDLVNCDVSKCVFCDGTHSSDFCFKARKLSFEERKDVLSNKRACFRCIKVGHLTRKCRSRLQCIICTKSHATLMCPDLPVKKQLPDDELTAVDENCTKDKALANHTSPLVFLQILCVVLKCNHRFREVRALIDTGSQRSYVLKDIAMELGYLPKHKENLIHCLFGGLESVSVHSCYDVTISKGSYLCTFEALDQPVICKDLCPIF